MDQMQWQMLQQALQSGAMGGASGMMGQAPMHMAPQMQEQQVPPGNPIADYLDSRSFQQSLSAPGKAAVAVPFAAGSGASLLAGHPLLAAFLGLGAANFGGQAAADYRNSQQNAAGADMWRERFGK
jgi:hypothetical protein